MSTSASIPFSLASLVTDWGGFEKFVARLHETGDVEVEHNVQLPAKSGGSYQIDVVVRSRRDPYAYLTIIECKYWNQPVKREMINALANVKDDVGADKAVCFTNKGFQSGAKQVASHRGIDLFLVKDLLPEDWSSPGRVIDLFLQVCQPAISPIRFPMCHQVPTPPFATSGLPLVDGDGNKLIYRPDGTTRGSVLTLAEDVRQHVWSKFSESQVRWSDDGIHYFKVPIRGGFEGGARFFFDQGFWYRTEAYECEVILQINQTRMVYDRATSQEYAVVVEDYVRGTNYLASRRKGAPASQIAPHGGPLLPPVPRCEVFRNGSIVRAQMIGWCDYETVRRQAAMFPEVEWPPSAQKKDGG